MSRSRILTGDKLIKSVRQRTMAPDDTNAFTDQDILDIINEEMDAQILDKLLTLQEEHLTIKQDFPRKNSGRYEIPYRAVGNKIRDVSILQGNTTYELSQVSISELSDFRNDQDGSSYLDMFYVESNTINLINPARAYNKMRFWYYLRPSVVTKMENAGIINNIGVNETTGIVTIGLSQTGKFFTTNEQYDIIGAKTPNKIRVFDLVPTEVSVVGNFIRFNLADLKDSLEDIKVGDYVTIAEETPVPNIPTEFHPILAQAAAINILESLGDTEALSNAVGRMQQMVQAVQKLTDDRVELAPKKIKPRHGPLNESVGRFRKGKGRGIL